MKNLAPEITRQRLLVEGFHQLGIVDKKTICKFFEKIAKELKLRAYGKPTIFSPGGLGKSENQGYDAFVPLIDSGISLYVWGNAKFVSLIIYTCKNFDEKRAIAVTRDFFKIQKIAFQSF